MKKLQANFGGMGGWTLVEMMMVVIISAVFVLAAVTFLDLSNNTIVHCRRDQAQCSNAAVALQGIGVNIRGSLRSGPYVVYQSYANQTAVSDGTAGGCLRLPYPGTGNDRLIYVSGGQLLIRNVSSGATQTLLSEGASSVSFTAEQSGSPLARTGAVRVTLTLTNSDGNVTVSSGFLPSSL